MAYFSKAQLLAGEGSFEGSFLELDGELAYQIPNGKSGTVEISLQYRNNDGSALVDDSGSPLPSFTDTIDVN